MALIDVYSGHTNQLGTIMQRKPTLAITNNSGDVFVRTYNTDEEARTLFNSTIYHSGREVVFTPLLETGSISITKN